jgi:hypothetical protein
MPIDPNVSSNPTSFKKLVQKKSSQRGQVDLSFVANAGKMLNKIAEKGAKIVLPSFLAIPDDGGIGLDSSPSHLPLWPQLGNPNKPSKPMTKK